MKFYIEGRGNQVHSPHNDAVWISYSFLVNLKNLLNKQSSCSRFTNKAVFWKGYQQMTNQQRDTTVIVSLLLAWTSSSTNSWVASHEISMLMVIHSRESSPFTTAQWCLFNVNQKRAFEQIVKLLEIYNVWMECRKCPFHRYWILVIPWFLNKQTDCITFPMNIVVVLKKLLNKQVSSLNKKPEFMWTKCHLSSNKYILAYLHRKPYGSCQGVIYSFGRRLLTIYVRSKALVAWQT